MRDFNFTCREIEQRNVGKELNFSALHSLIKATASDWSIEYLDAALSIKTVSDVDEAIQHVNHYGSHHTDAIIAQDKTARDKFLESGRQRDRDTQRINAICRWRRVWYGRRDWHLDRTAATA
jgi:gamma-glutamyl phosphate reductase